MTDLEKAPSATHEAFARAIVETCRKHGMQSISASYYAGFRTKGDEEFSGRVTITWSEGTRGAKGRIDVKFDGVRAFDEEAPHRGGSLHAALAKARGEITGD